MSLVDTWTGAAAAGGAGVVGAGGIGMAASSKLDVNPLLQTSSSGRLSRVWLHDNLLSPLTSLLSLHLSQLLLAS